MNMMTPLPGCAPSGDMGGLIGCYSSVQAASALISALMIDAINNNPAVTDAIIAAIQKSGSNVPLIGVTNGSAAQPGQVGEFVSLQVVVNFPAANTTQIVQGGTLQPGDWDVWTFAIMSVFVNDIFWVTSPTPAGFSSNIWAGISMGSAGLAEGVVPVSGAVQASISVPTMIVYSLTTNGQGTGPGAGNLTLFTNARRRR